MQVGGSGELKAVLVGENKIPEPEIARHKTPELAGKVGGGLSHKSCAQFAGTRREPGVGGLQKNRHVGVFFFYFFCKA